MADATTPCCLTRCYGTGQLSRRLIRWLMEASMSGLKLILVWIACVILGAAAGFLAGYVLWKLGFELIGSAVAIVGAGAGGIVAFIWFLNWQDSRQP
jgi:hypothetical protein